MPCYFPLHGWRSKAVNPSGKRSIVFNPNLGYRDLPVTVPCGQCVGCRLERSRQWAIRCVHEASLYDQNCFITLTYNSLNLPSDKSLHKDHFQKFMKRLRFSYPHQRIRFFHAGEYGEKFQRPHYHACLFNFDFPDKVLFKQVNGNDLYTSQSLDNIWGCGFSLIGSVTFESAAYVARYIMKKITGKHALEHYAQIDTFTGEIIAERQPEYTTMSNRPGIGRDWFDKFASDVYPDDFIVLNQKKLKTPRYYDSRFEILFPDEYKSVKSKRKLNAEKNLDDNTYDRLQIKHEAKLIQTKNLKRSYHDDP